MPTIEILAYQPKDNDMEKFIKFCMDGKRKPNGEHDVDGQGRKITGVLRWLHSREVPEAHFFDSGKDDRRHFFVATVHRLEDFDVPWMRRIPGFEAAVTTEGLIGTTGQFAPPSELLTALKPNDDLDARFAEGKAKLDQVLAKMQQEQVFSFDKRKLLAALRGDKEINVQAVFAEVEDKLKFSL